MAVEEVFQDKFIKAKVVTVGEWLIQYKLTVDELIGYAHIHRDL